MLAQTTNSTNSTSPYATKEEACKVAAASFAEATRLSNAPQTAESYRDTVKALQLAAAAYHACDDKRLEAAIFNRIGRLYFFMGQKQEALKYYGLALPIQLDLGDQRDEAITLNNIGIVYANLGQNQEALKYFGQALPIERNSGDGAGEARTLSNTGKVYSDLGQMREALKYFGQALSIQRNVGDRAGEARTLTNIGKVSSDLGQMQEALKYYGQALPILHDVGDRAGEAATLNDIGEVYNALGQKQEALNRYRQALAIKHEVGDRTGEARTLTNIGIVYYNLGQAQEALRYYEQALPIERNVGDRAGESATLNDIGQVYDTLGRKQEALQYYELSLQIKREVGDHAGEGITLNNIGRFYAVRGQKQDALKYYAQALPIEREVGDRAAAARTLDHLMHLDRTDDPPLAILFGKQAVNVLQELRRNISGLSKEAQQGFAESNEETYRTLAGLLIDSGRFFEAEQVMDLLKDHEYFEFIQRSGPVAGTGPVALNDQLDIQPLVKLEMEKSTLAAKEILSPAEQQRKEYLDGQLKIAEQAAGEFFDDMGRVRLPKNLQIGTVRANNEEGKEARSLQKDLEYRPNTVAIYTLVSEDRFRSVLITPKVMKAEEYNITRAELSKKVYAFRVALRDPSKDPVPLARELYHIVVGDLDKELIAANATTILWSLDNVLRYVPMAALHDGHQYLASRFRNVIYSKASCRACPREHGDWKALGAGVSLPYEGLPALDNVPSELASIIRSDGQEDSTGILPGTMLLNQDFTAAAFRAALHRNYNVVHIASHFEFNPGNDLQSYLLVGDGKLTLAELRENSDYTFAGVQLLTLSACDTAAGATADGREIDGLGFLAEEKGAHAIVATLWKVDDESTRLFMQRFYQQLSAPNVTTAEALQYAELALLHREARPREASPIDFTHPFFWAPFVLLGNGN